MRHVLLFILGLAAGAAISMLVYRGPSVSVGVAALHQGAIETGIDVLDKLRDGDEATAKLLVASMVDSHIVMWEKLPQDGRSDLSEGWRLRMSEYNKELELSLPEGGSNKKP